MKQYNRVCARINLDAIAYNMEQMKNRIGQEGRLIAVIKTDAYGHGAVPLAEMFEETPYIWGYAVACMGEARTLRAHGIKKPILILGCVFPDEYEEMVEKEIRAAVYTEEMAQGMAEAAAKSGKTAFLHIKIDTGMSRIGFEASEESIDQIVNISNLNNLYIEGIYTHFAKSDEIDKDFTYKQADRFKFMVDSIEKIGINIPIKHVSNSAATIDLPDLNFNMVRCGIVLYGYYPSDEVTKDKLQLKPAMTLKTKVAHIKELKEDTGISYGLKYKTSKLERIITIPIGYADGFTRMQNNPKVSINNEIFDVVGRICMDQCMVRIDKDIDIKIGDEVIIFGESNINADNIAKDLGTINYEIVCMVSRRVDRIYKERNVILQADSYLVKLKR